MGDTTDPSGYQGPLRWVEYAINGRKERGHWDTADSLAARLRTAAEQNFKWTDAHVQIAHYPRALPFAVPITYEREGKEADPERLTKLDQLPQLANFILDIDDENVEEARRQAQVVTAWLAELEVPEGNYFISFSTGKGFHISIPWQLLGVPAGGIPGLNWDVYKLLAVDLQQRLGLPSLDMGLYRKNGFIRMENTIHPKTGLYKVRITPGELALPIEELRRLGEKPRLDVLPPPEFDEPNPMLQMLYQKAQIKGDRARREREVGGSTARPLSPEVLAELRGGLTPCLTNIPLQVTPDVDNNRNNTAFRAVMMLKHQGRSYEECEAYLHEWLGSKFNEIGAKATLDSAYNGQFSGGCQWMRESGFASLDECAACPIGQRHTKGKPAREEEPVFAQPPEGAIELPTMDEMRRQLQPALASLEGEGAYVMRVPAGGGKTYQTMRHAIGIAERGGRVLFFVRDTRKLNGLAAEMHGELRGLGFEGKVETLYGRNTAPNAEGNEHIPRNCDNWRKAGRYAKRGYSVASAVCGSCVHRDTCGYYEQFSRAYEPGIYIAPHAMLPTLFGGEHEAFKQRQAVITGGTGLEDVGDGLGDTAPALALGGALELVVIDEDTLGDWVEPFEIMDYHLENELRESTRVIRARDKFSGKRVIVRSVELDHRWLQIVKWLRVCIGTEGPVIYTLDELARHAGKNLATMLRAINPNLLLDPDYEANKGHKPFTKRLYRALMADLERLEDGNPTVMPDWNSIKIFGVTEITLPADVPLLVLDAYARRERYEAFFRAARINRPLHFLDFQVREQPRVTYVLDAALTSKVVGLALDGEGWAVRIIENIIAALKNLTKDGKRTLIVARRNLIQSDLLKRLIADSPHLIAEDEETGSLHFWRGRGINSASGERIAVIQDPNPPPAAVLQEASALYADEPRLDQSRVKGAYPVVWADHAKKAEGWVADRWEYADERLNVVQRAMREDELVQMSLRGRSITTGAEIILFTDYVDARLPAERVFLLPALASGEHDDSGAREALYGFIWDHKPEALSVSYLQRLGIVSGESEENYPSLTKKIMLQMGGFYNRLRRAPIDPQLAAEEIEAFKVAENG